MSVLLDEETDTVILEGLDFEIPCYVTEPPHAAEVVAICRFCGFEAFLCKEHWKRDVDRITEYLARRPFMVLACQNCERHAPTYDELIRVVDL